MAVVGPTKVPRACPPSTQASTREQVSLWFKHRARPRDTGGQRTPTSTDDARQVSSASQSRPTRGDRGRVHGRRLRAPTPSIVPQRRAFGSPVQAPQVMGRHPIDGPSNVRCSAAVAGLPARRPARAAVGEPLRPPERGARPLVELHVDQNPESWCRPASRRFRLDRPGNVSTSASTGMSSFPLRSCSMVRSRCTWTISPLIPAAANPRPRSRSARLFRALRAHRHSAT